jgi:predicted RNA-binding protein with EMAP domain
MDTANNAKILMAERCAKDLKNLFNNMRGVGKDAVKIINEIEHKILEMKYFYGDINALSPFLNSIKSEVLELYNLLGGKDWSSRLRRVNIDETRISKVKFCMNILYNLESRLHLPEDPAYAVDIRVGEIDSVMKHPKANKLKVCNVNVGRMITVVTNIENVKDGEKLPVALLPPAEFFGVVSEGMFLSHNLKDGKPGELPKLDEEELNNARKEILKYLK